MKNLTKGTGWSARTLKGLGKKDSRLTKRGSKVFSKQMPFGLDPWLRHQRELLKTEIAKNIGGIK